MDAPAKQQITDRLKSANNILVTVASNPTVDQLSACIGLTLLLNKMGKHATAVFSGKVPPVVDFLQPEKTIETNTDSLRDFIISLDKAKADKLRYKVEDKFVRIFITPYKTSLSEKDLVFSQGDFNVEVVVALGVANRTQIDAAITAHGRIFHDATVISINTGSGKASDIGQINWQETTASSLCEMLVSISEAFGAGLIDNQMATAFLTGIVAETARFSNNKTSPKVMTMSAQLMAAGANQQLIVSKLEPPPPPPPKPEAPKPPRPKPSEPSSKPPPAKEPVKKEEGTLSVSHEASRADSPEVEIAPNEIHIDEQGNLKTAAELKEEMEKRAKTFQPALPPEPSAPEPAPPPASEEPLPPLPPPLPQATPAPAHQHPLPEEAEAPEAGPAKPTEDGHIPGPHELLNANDHTPTMTAPFTANTQPEWKDPYSTVPIDPLASPTKDNDVIFGHSPIVAPSGEPTQPPGVGNARNAVQSAFAGIPDTSPVQALNAVPMTGPLHEPPASGTPGLDLPASQPLAPPPPSDMAPPAPPPVPPPPLILPTQPPKTS